MIPLAVPNLSGNERKYLNECIDSTFVSSVGPFVNRFETLISEKTKAKYTVALSSGTAALHTALMAVGVKRDDLVILPSFTFIASSNSIAHCGATPWLFDVDMKTWTLDVELLKEKLETETKVVNGELRHAPTGRRISAIMPVYTLGLPAQMRVIKELGQKYNLPIVADAAPALGAEYLGKPLSEWADLTVYSFNGNKTITTGAGGAITGNNENILKLARHLSTTARKGQDYDHDIVGYNYRMTNLQAAVGCAQLENLKEFVEAKRNIRRNYDEAFKNIKGLGFFPRGEKEESVCWFSGVTIESENLPTVPEISLALKDKGIEARNFWKPSHLQEPYKDAPRTRQNVSESIWKKILTLPCSTHLSDKDQPYVIKTLTEILQGGR